MKYMGSKKRSEGSEDINTLIALDVAKDSKNEPEVKIKGYRRLRLGE